LHDVIRPYRETIVRRVASIRLALRTGETEAQPVKARDDRGRRTRTGRPLLNRSAWRSPGVRRRGFILGGLFFLLFLIRLRRGPTPLRIGVAVGLLSDGGAHMNRSEWRRDIKDGCEAAHCRTVNAPNRYKQQRQNGQKGCAKSTNVT